MNVNDIRIAITVVSFLVFLGIVFWAYSSRRKRAFDEAAQLPFADEEFPPSQLDARHGEGKIAGGKIAERTVAEGTAAERKVAERKTP